MGQDHDRALQEQLHPGGLPVRRGPLNILGDVEYLTADYIAWYSQLHLMHRLGRVPPPEAEAQYCSQHVTEQRADSKNAERA